MSAEHHSPPRNPAEEQAEQQAVRRMLEEFLGKSKPQFPQGRISPNDEGELSFAVALDADNRAVVVRFAKPVDWIGLSRDSALHLADLLIQKAAALPKTSE